MIDASHRDSAKARLSHASVSKRQVVSNVFLSLANVNMSLVWHLKSTSPPSERRSTNMTHNNKTTDSHRIVIIGAGYISSSLALLRLISFPVLAVSLWVSR